MTTTSESKRHAEMREFINTEYLRYKRDSNAAADENEIALPSVISINISSDDEVIIQAVCELEKFLDKCMGINVSDEAEFQIDLKINNSAGKIFDPLKNDSEEFSISTDDNSVIIEAAFNRGIMQGVQYFKRLIADRCAPFIKKGKISKSPAFMPRISNSIFIHSHQDFGDLEQFSEDYLSLMSYFGINGVHLHIDIWDLCKNSVIPDLNTPDFAENISKLKTVVARLNRYGIDAYLYFLNKRFPNAEKIFADDITVRGAESEGMPELPSFYVLCTSSERVLKCYEETVTNIVTEIPALAGIILIVGGEGFMHCYTRPRGRDGGYTNCPQCHDIDPSVGVAKLTDRITAAVKKCDPQKAVFVWLYSAFTWSGEDRWQKAWINNITEGQSVMSNFSTGSADQTTGEDVMLYDYNIKSPEASTNFAAQAAECKKLGKKMYAKIESDTSPSVFFLPYIPVHYRWHKRYSEMKKVGAVGFIGQWRFYGMSGTLPEEIQYHAAWNPELSTEECLLKAAKRDFKVDGEGCTKLLQGWKSISEAWDDFPYSALTAGERAFYMRGPLHFGPSHPFIFDPQNRYGLSQKFFQLRGDLFEGGQPDEIEEMIKNAPPRYVSELLFVFPFGTEKYLKLLNGAINKWDSGLAMLESVFADDKTERAEMELGICKIMSIHLHTIRNLVRFLDIKNQLYREHSSKENYREKLTELKRILSDEIENAEAAFPILKKDNRIGYGHSYGLVYDTEMVEEKITQCRHVRDKELPIIDSGIKFHLWNDF
ncbi:MAG: hypothetical protein ACYTFY_10835 [Planctomycetota bacterium]|jgi:hypothetical protein